jgi:hypothetical protein
MRRLLSLIVFAGMIASSGAASAQDAEGEPTAPGSVETERAEPPAAPAPASEESPFDYESSEEISEDLSVSFPVDI